MNLHTVSFSMEFNNSKTHYGKPRTRIQTAVDMHTSSLSDNILPKIQNHDSDWTQQDSVSEQLVHTFTTTLEIEGCAWLTRLAHTSIHLVVIHLMFSSPLPFLKASPRFLINIHQPLPPPPTIKRQKIYSPHTQTDTHTDDIMHT